MDYDPLNLTSICEELCKIDGSFPPKDFWKEYYNIKELGDIIVIGKKRKSNWSF
jgi:hypothetical protein